MELNEEKKQKIAEGFYQSRTDQDGTLEDSKAWEPRFLRAESPEFQESLEQSKLQEGLEVTRLATWR